MGPGPAQQDAAASGPRHQLPPHRHPQVAAPSGHPHPRQQLRPSASPSAAARRTSGSTTSTAPGAAVRRMPSSVSASVPVRPLNIRQSASAGDGTAAAFYHPSRPSLPFLPSWPYLPMWPFSPFHPCLPSLPGGPEGPRGPGGPDGPEALGSTGCAWRSMCCVCRSSSCIWWAISATACATSTEISTAPRTRWSHGLGGVSFTLLTSSLTVCADEGVDGEDPGEADLLVGCLPSGDLTGPGSAHHRTEPPRQSSRRRTTSPLAGTGQRQPESSAGQRADSRPATGSTTSTAPSAAVRRMSPSVTARAPVRSWKG